jgi:hypothetical protein
VRSIALFAVFIANFMLFCERFLFPDLDMAGLLLCIRLR